MIGPWLQWVLWFSMVSQTVELYYDGLALIPNHAVENF